MRQEEVQACVERFKLLLLYKEQEFDRIVNISRVENPIVMYDSKTELLEDIERMFTDMLAYQEKILKLYLGRLEHASSEEIMKRDKDRTIKHNVVIDDFSLLNRVCKWLNIEEIIMQADMEDRKNIAAVSFAIVNELVVNK